jgi:predicted O-methyltransferase YrrM
MDRQPLLREDVLNYLRSMSLREPPILRHLREQIAQGPDPRLAIPPEHAQFLALLLQLMGARHVIEVGVFMGYSSLAMALALPEDGRIIACDVSEEYTAVARRYWHEAGVDHMIHLRLAPALETLHELLAKGGQGRFDFVFIDADKTNYEGYYECALELLRPGGLIMADNTLWSGRVADPQDTSPDTRALRAFNEKLHGDTRVALSLVPIGDGVTLALKR